MTEKPKNALEDLLGWQPNKVPASDVIKFAEYAWKHPEIVELVRIQMNSPDSTDEESEYNESKLTMFAKKYAENNGWTYEERTAFKYGYNVIELRLENKIVDFDCDLSRKSIIGFFVSED